MDVILHIGQYKTGSSSIQRFLKFNRKVLEEFGYFYDMCDADTDGHYKRDDNSHFLMFQNIFNNPMILKKCIEQIMAKAEEKKCHTVIFSSEALFTHEFPEEYIKTIVYLKRQDLYIESSWQQWGFRHYKYNNFIDYVQKVTVSDYYQRLLIWRRNVKEIIVTPFEKKYFSNGLEKHFLKAIGIIKYNNFSFNYVSKDDHWGVNKGLTPEAISIALLSRDLIYKYKDDNILHKFFNKYLADIFEKEHFSKYNLFTYEQRMQVLKQFEATNRKIAIGFLNSDQNLFETPEPYQGSASNEVHKETLIRAMVNVGVKQDQMIQDLIKRVEFLEKNG